MASPRSRRDRMLDALPILVIGFGIAAVIFAFSLGSDGDDQDANLDPAIEELLPARGSEVLRQSPVGIDLASGYEAVLYLNGTRIPEDQVNVLRDAENPETSAENPGDFASTINRFTFSPLEGRVVEVLNADENCARAEFWPASDPSDISTVEWCFTVA